MNRLNREYNKKRGTILNSIHLPCVTGYIRALLSVIAFWHMHSNYVVGFWCYFIGVALDEVDGNAARALNQCKCLFFC